jgi:16S rRNA (cytosine1402-N4)-methyltransferase
MVDEVLDFLITNKKGIYVDATLGCGGHTLAILENTNAFVIGFELDLEQIKLANQRLSKLSGRSLFVHGNYNNMDKFLDGGVDGVLFDFGLSSYQLDNKERGFSYREEGPLDMRFGERGSTLADIMEEKSEEEIADILYYYGGERASRRIAKKIKREKPKTTGELALLVRKTVPRNKAHKHLGKVFQAFRIAVNNELENIEKGIIAAAKILKGKGRLITIAYHKEEEKLICRTAKKEKLKALTGKPLKPTKDEFEFNPRCRSAHLRVFEK